MEDKYAKPNYYYFNDRNDTNLKVGDHVTFVGQFRLVENCPERTDCTMNAEVIRLPNDGFTLSGRRIYASEGKIVVVVIDGWRQAEPYTRPCFPLEWEEDTKTQMRVPIEWLYPKEKEET